MVDIDKQVAHWRDGSQEDMEVARELITHGRTRHGLFFAHLSLEKALKAHICRQTRELAPRVHNLVRLVEQAALKPDQKQMDILAEMNAFNVEGRYPETLGLPPTPAEAQSYLSRADEVFQWLIQQL